MITRCTFEPKLATETVLVDFPFTLPVGVTISSATVAALVYSGTDASPSSLISGSDTTSGSVVSQLITGGTAGNIYQLLCTATCSDSQVLQLAGYLSVVPPLL